jgi:alkylated DNA repair dioxygenase AlkB
MTLLDVGAIWIVDNFVPDAEALFAQLASSVTWDDRLRSRKAASFGLPYNYSGITYPETIFPDLLLPILDRLERRLAYRPNNCLAHLYADGRSTLGFHADATDDLAPGCGIAVISLGAERPITFRSMADKSVQEEHLLKSGSLLFMSAEMQRDWKHAILAQENAGPRISLTFRRVRGA